MRAVACIVYEAPDIQAAWEEIYADEFGIPTFNPTDWEGGVANNVVPPFVVASIDMRTTRRFAEEWPKIVMPGKFEVFPYGSDQPAFKRNGIPMVIYGPGDVEKLHSPEDRVHSGAIEECRENIRNIIEEFALSASA